MSSFILIQENLDWVAVQDFSISFYLKKKHPRRNMVVFIPLIIILFSEEE